MATAAQLGYDPTFLGPAVPLPTPADAVHELPYTHFTVLLDPARRLAAVTGVNIDGSSLREIARTGRWSLDGRVDEDAQAGASLYKDNDLDRGHLVRRTDPMWGNEETAVRAAADTFHYPNAAPQAAEFNQSHELWNGLEEHVLEHARAHRLRLNVLAAPVLATGDPVYRGVPIPGLFWKVAAWSTGESGGLGAAAFLLDQRPVLDLERRVPGPGEPPPLGPFRTFQVPVEEVTRLTGLELGPLVGADRYAAPREVGVSGWSQLRDLAAVQL